jgi:plastocyanin
MRVTAVSLAVSALALVVASAVGAASRGTVAPISGTVGPGYTISLKSRSRTVSALVAGKYTFVISDKSSIHNFHLMGPGVDKKTTVAFVGTTRWAVVLRAGTYTFQCDPHAAMMGGQSMRGQFVVRAR